MANLLTPELARARAKLRPSRAAINIIAEELALLRRARARTRALAVRARVLAVCRLLLRPGHAG